MGEYSNSRTTNCVRVAFIALNVVFWVSLANTWLSHRKTCLWLKHNSYLFLDLLCLATAVPGPQKSKYIAII